MKQPKGLNYIKEPELEIAKLYDTTIVKVDANGSLTLNTGGWFTNHTKKCMNLVLGNRGKVLVKKGQWYFETATGDLMKFNSEGKVL